MSRIAARLAREKAWDQSVFNEEIFFLSHDEYVSPNISVRVMNIFKFLNSKVRQSAILPATLCARFPDAVALAGTGFTCYCVSSATLSEHGFGVSAERLLLLGVALSLESKRKSVLLRRRCCSSSSGTSRGRSRCAR